ncbi:MAG: SGNH/GDSL hydrolase family protein [Burkholderiaceae bacterium]|nr:SGNH/GDSL hydrolase family protein [Burkholderiaceae bacterium]
MSLALKLALAPVLIAQAVATRRRAPVLPEAAGDREGLLGAGSDPLHLLIAGDSSAAGVGVAHQDQAFVGHLSRALQRRLDRPIRWSLQARSGLTTRQVHAMLRETWGDKTLPAAQLAVVLTGVNDVIDQIGVRRAMAERVALADWLLGERGVEHVVFAPLPPVHRFPLLPRPLRDVMGSDARRHDEAIARWAATRRDVSHTPIEFDLSTDAMASDGFHPGEPVYRACGEALAAHIAGLARFKLETHT